jgi:hypothetical protein
MAAYLDFATVKLRGVFARLDFASTARAPAVMRFGVILKPAGKLRSRIIRATWRRERFAPFSAKLESM